jgi:hypothetical protein
MAPRGHDEAAEAPLHEAKLDEFRLQFLRYRLWAYRTRRDRQDGKFVIVKIVPHSARTMDCGTLPSCAGGERVVASSEGSDWIYPQEVTRFEGGAR